MNIINFLNQLIKKIKQKYPANATHYAWWLIEKLTSKNKQELLNVSTLYLSPEQENQLDEWVYELITLDKPLAYILEHVPFLDCEILIKPPILIPRPETEEWCLNLINELKKDKINSFTMIDMCTGSGCIAIAFAKAFPKALVYAIDINSAALTLAKKNAKHNNVSNINFILSDLFSNLDRNMYVDFIVSNPPYITQEEFNFLEPSVKKWEDYSSLVSNDEGLEIIKKIIREAKSYISPYFSKKHPQFPSILIEIGFKQGNIVKEILEYNNYSYVMIRKDYQGHDRTVQGNISYDVLEKKI